MSNQLSIRFATEADADLIVSFISDLAEYEKLLHEVTATAEDIRKSLFGARVFAECLLAFDGGEAVGFAVFFHNYSTFLGKPGLYLEDLFVKPEARGRGTGRALLRRLAEITLERGLCRMEWAVLDWNKPSIEFYESLDAKAMDDWTVYRLAGDALGEMAGN